MRSQTTAKSAPGAEPLGSKATQALVKRAYQSRLPSGIEASWVAVLCVNSVTLGSAQGWCDPNVRIHPRISFLHNKV